MSLLCSMCSSQETLEQWVHPVTKIEYGMCSFCKSVILGVCCECNDIIHSSEPFAIEEEEKYLCELCAFKRELTE